MSDSNLPPGCKSADIPGHGYLDEIFEEGERCGKNGNAIPEDWDGHYEDSNKAHVFISGWLRGRAWWIVTQGDRAEVERLLIFEYEN